MVKHRDFKALTVGLITIFVSLTGFVLLFHFFNHIHNSRFGDDFGAHFQIGLGESLNYSNTQPHWLFFQLVREAYHVSGSRVFAYNVFIGMAAAATIFKYLFFVFHTGLRPALQSRSWLEPKRHLLAIGLLFCAVIPLVTGFGELMFLGYVSPSCWRSTTTIVSIPFAVLLFYGTIQLLEKAKTGWYWVALLIVLEVVLIQVKPSYMLAYLPSISVLTLVFFLTGKLDRKELIQYFVIAFVATLALAERKLSQGSSDRGALVLLPFQVWLHWVDNSPVKLILALVSSVALPLVYWVECKIKNQKVSTTFIFAALVFAISILEYLLLAEPGVYTFCRNVIWQSMTASTIIHMVVAQQAYEKNNFFTLGYLTIEVIVGLNWFRLLLMG